MLPTPEGGGFSQLAGDSFQGGTDTSYTGFTLRERIAQPKPCACTVRRHVEAAFKAVHRAVLPQAGKSGNARRLSSPAMKGGAFSRELDKAMGRRCFGLRVGARNADGWSTVLR
jgi:hypothetical protein